MPSRSLSILTVVAILAIIAPAALAGANRFVHLDGGDPYYVDRDFPRLATPQWVGEPSVDAVVVLAIDDMRGHEKWEAFLRPLLERLKRIDGRAPVSIMTNQIDPADQHLQAWLAEGVSLETHTFDHPCPLLAGGDFAKAKSTYDRCVDLMASVPGSHPVAFRTPCCDSLNTLSPRFFAEIFNRTTPQGNYLAIDSSVFCLLTSNDPALPRELVIDADGRERFRKYLPFSSFVNTIEDYPYPYVIGRLAWEFPCIVPSDWEAQNLQRPNNPRTVADMQAALDAVVVKQGVFDLVFHPHGWIRAEQLVELVDHAVARYQQRVKFLTFREALERLNQYLLKGEPLRASDGGDNGVRLLDLNDDGFLDVVIGNERTRLTRLWLPEQREWRESEFPIALTNVGSAGQQYDAGAHFAVVRDNGYASVIVRNQDVAGAWHFDGHRYVPAPELLAGLEVDGQPINTAHEGTDRGVRFVDVDNDGRTECLVGNDSQKAVFRWSPEAARWEQAKYSLPSSVTIVDEAGHDRGLRLVDLDDDFDLDVVYSNEQESAVYLFAAPDTGWATEALALPRSEADGLPMIARGETDNGAWFHSRHLWAQNEDTARLPDLVDRRSFNDMLSATSPEPKSPAASLKALKARDGFRVELVAAEPLLADPVDFDWSPDGRLWVAEMGDYPTGAGGSDPGGRVRCLTDTDGDGRYDESSDFLDGLSYPNGVAAWRNGVLVMAAPDILYAEDTDGDGRADKCEVLFTGLSESNPQHRANGLVRGLDGWFYCAVSDHRGTITSKSGEEFNIGGRDFRIKPDEGIAEPLLGNTQFIRSRDDWDNWFGNDNIHPMWQFLLEDRYLRRNPHVAAPRAADEVPTNPGSAPVFPRSRTLERFNDLHTANHFTSACATIVYRDELLGPTYIGNSFVCEPVHNLVHREVMKPQGLRFTSRRAFDEQNSEFLASTDNWFRPVRVRTGPDGALWIADMYRAVIEHPEWIPESVIATTDLRVGSGMGRIYRVYPVGRRPQDVPRLSNCSSVALVAALEEPSGTLRDLAQQLLVERRDRETVAPLEKLSTDGQRATARLHALYTLRLCGWLTPEIALKALSDPHPGVRRHAIRLAEPLLDDHPDLVDALLDLASDEDAHIRQQLAYTLGETDGPRAGAALVTLAATAPNDELLRAAVMSSALPHVEGMSAELAKSDAPPAELVADLLATATASGNNAAVVALLGLLAKSNGQEFAAWQIEACVAGLDSLDRHNQSLAEFAKSKTMRDAVKSLEPLFAFARSIASAAERPETERVSAVALLGRSKDAYETDVELLCQLLGPESPADLQAAALHQLGSVSNEATQLRLLRDWRSYSPRLRAGLLALAMQSRPWLNALLNAMENKDLTPRDLDASHRQQLLTHRSDAIRERAAVLLADDGASDRRAVLESFSAAREMSGDPVRGAAVFEKRCAVCHQFDGKGHAIGPDLGALTDKSSEAMLTAVLDPNRAVEAKYVSYTALTAVGLTFNGLLVDETTASITLLAQEGKQQTVLRTELETLESSGKSLMPEGLEKDVTPEELADCFAYIRAGGPQPKQIPGNQPAVVQAEALRNELPCLPTNCEIYGDTLRIEEVNGALGWWNSENDHAVWTLDAPRAGRYAILLEWSCPDSAAGNTYVLDFGHARLSRTVESTGDWNNYHRELVGYVELPEGMSRLGVRSEGKIRDALFDLKSITLRPSGS